MIDITPEMLKAAYLAAPNAISLVDVHNLLKAAIAAAPAPTGTPFAFAVQYAESGPVVLWTRSALVAENACESFFPLAHVTPLYTRQEQPK